MERGEFNNRSGKGKPIDLSDYFETPEESWLANLVLKNAGMTPREVDLLKEIAELKQILAAIIEDKKKAEINQQIQQKQLKFSLVLERQKHPRRQR